MSIYADGYWKMGWAGVLLFSASAGLILSVTTLFNYRYIVDRNLIFLPAIFLGNAHGCAGAKRLF